MVLFLTQQGVPSICGLEQNFLSKLLRFFSFFVFENFGNKPLEPTEFSKSAAFLNPTKPGDSSRWNFCSRILVDAVSWLPSWELTYPFPKGTFEDDFPFTKVGYASSLEGRWCYTFRVYIFDNLKSIGSFIFTIEQT